MKSIDLFIHNVVELHEDQVEGFLAEQKGRYHSVQLVGHKVPQEEWAVRNPAVQKCAGIKRHYWFVVDSDVQVDNTFALELFIEQNCGVVAPMLIRSYTAWNNFLGSLSSDDYYSRSLDYKEILATEDIATGCTMLPAGGAAGLRRVKLCGEAEGLAEDDRRRGGESPAD
jgi:procollagen-lysine,2-oxoglutarate 5-dioxygenase